ncbi:hypothetical protein ACM55I_10280 [Flavobacterium sp. GB2R13]|uniref:hypothetical protein n=1 Tax=Flavobacterium algoris TaxID=3398733 RepID=UPI003A842C33
MNNIIKKTLSFYRRGIRKVYRLCGLIPSPLTRKDKIKIENEIKKNTIIGINSVPRKDKIIVSLTSFPERMYDIHFTLHSLLNQNLKPDKIILWLGEEEFPNKEKDIPEMVLNMKQNGLTIKWCEDIKSYKKLIYALNNYPRDIIVTADDDVYYQKKWLELLYESYKREPLNIHCHRASRIQFDDAKDILPYKHWQSEIKSKSASYLNFLTGCGGVLYPPGCFYHDVSTKEYFMKLCPTADDIWFWAMVVLNERKVTVVKNNIYENIDVNPERSRGKTNEKSLFKINVHGEANDIQLKNLLIHYPNLLIIINKR